MNSDRMVEALAKLQVATIYFYRSGEGLELCRRMSDPDRTANVRQDPDVFDKDNPYGRGRQLQEMVLDNLDTKNCLFLRYQPGKYDQPVLPPMPDAIVYLNQPVVVDEPTNRMVQVIAWKVQGDEVLFSTFCPPEAHGLDPALFGGAPIILVAIAAIPYLPDPDEDPMATLLWDVWSQISEQLELTEDVAFDAEGYVAGLAAGMDAVIPERPTDVGDEG